MEHREWVPPDESSEEMTHEGGDMLSFLAALGDDDNEYVGEAVDMDEILARELQRQEEEMEDMRLRVEASDRELARIESERERLFGLSNSQEARDMAFAAALAQEEKDAEFAARMAREDEQRLTRSAEARAAADFAFALSLQEDEGGNARVSDSDRAVALALVEAERAEEELRQRRARQAEQRARDEEYARQLMQQEQQQIQIQQQLYEDVDSDSGGAEGPDGPANLALPKIAGYNGHNLTSSKESILSRGEHSEFLAGCDVSYFKQFLAAHHNCVVRPVINSQLRAKFVARRDRMAAQEAERGVVRLAFHGTRVRHIQSIERGGLKVPGADGVNHESDSGWWGKGYDFSTVFDFFCDWIVFRIYSSYDPNYAAGYGEAGKLIVVAVLLGRAYSITKRRDGGKCEPGYDSHVAEGGREYVCFCDDQVLPLFVIDTMPKAAVILNKPQPKKPNYKKKK